MSPAGEEGSLLQEIVRGVYILTTRKDRTINGMTITWVSRVTKDPVYLAAAVYHENYSNEIMKESDFFTLHILREGQEELARNFGTRSGKKCDKFADIAYLKRNNRPPVLKTCLGYFDCKKVFSKELTDHTLFVGELVEEKRLMDGDPLIFQYEDYYT